MENIKIETSQNVDIEYELASIGDRILATLLDYLFFIAYFLLILLISAFTSNLLFKSIAVVSVLSLPIVCYDLVCETFLQGKSFGKMIMKIKVVKLDGTRANFGAYLLRWLFRVVDTKIFSGAIALIVVLLNGKGQRLGDVAAGTTVIKMKSTVSLNDTILNRVKPEYAIVFTEVKNLNDNDISIIKEVMRISIQTDNLEAIEKLALKTKAAMGITTNLPHAQFLATVVQDYSQFDFEK